MSRHPHDPPPNLLQQDPPDRMSPAKDKPQGRAVAIGCLAVGCVGVSLLLLAALLFPAILAAREAARRMQCGNNVKQLSLGIQNYHDTFMYTPYGARCRTTGANNEVSWGPSWMLSLSPYCEKGPLYDRVESADRADPAHDYMHEKVWQASLIRRLSYLHCPSSPFPKLEPRRPAGGAIVELVTPSYVGIAGAWGDIPNPAGGKPLFRENRGFPVNPNGGMMSGGGMLPPNEALTFASVIDGTAYQIVLSETSDYYGSAPRVRIDGAGERGAWFVGCNTPAKAKVIPGFGPLPEPETGSIYNLMTIRYGMISKRGLNIPACGVGDTGIHSDKGANNPLNSAHPNGAMVGYLDGHVELLTYQVSELIIKRLATRDDGGVIDGP